MSINHVKLKIGITEIEVSGVHEGLEGVAIDLLRQTFEMMKNVDPTLSSGDGPAETKELGNLISNRSFAEFMDIFDPQSLIDTALVAAVWLQVREQKENFLGRDVNSLLKDAGRAIKNITNALTSLQQSKPALVIQISKNRGNKRGQKIYKVTEPGIKSVLEMQKMESKP